MDRQLGAETGHALLITCYQSTAPLQIRRIIDFLGPGFSYYIHVNRKSRADFSSFRRMDRVHVFNKYRVNHGSFNQLLCVLFLCRQALRDPRNRYFHLLTESDFPTRDAQYFHREVGTGVDYLESFRLPSDRWYRGGLNRVRHVLPYELINDRSWFGGKILSVFMALQTMLRVKRRAFERQFPDVYGGSAYWSLTRDTLVYVMSVLAARPEILKSLRYTFGSDEVLFQTVVLNSPHGAAVHNDNRRYIDWVSGRGRRGRGPAVLDESDFVDIEKSNALFARKFDVEESERLRKLLLSSMRTGLGRQDDYPVG